MAKLTTLGVTIGVGYETTPGTKPTKFTRLDDCSEIGGVEQSVETIDVSDLSNYSTEYAAGRADTGGEWALTFILDPQKSVLQLKDLFAKAKAAKEAGKATWFEVVFPDMAEAFFLVAEPGSEIPMPQIGQNEAATIEITLAVNIFKGLDTKVALTEWSAS